MLKLIITVSLLTTSLLSYAATLQGRVVGVTDGDTITVLDSTNAQYKVRLSGIDAPEKKQPFGEASKQSLSELIYDRTILVDWSKQDRYGRNVGKVIYRGVDVNLEQVKRGLAWHYSKYKNEQPFDDRLAYVLAQEEAIKKKLGLWQEPAPIAPWEWRKQ